MSEDHKRATYRALEERVVRGDGVSSVDARARAFADDVMASERELEAAKASGTSEDAIFELVVCSAVGRAARMYDAGLAALAEARRGHAS